MNLSPQPDVWLANLKTFIFPKFFRLYYVYVAGLFTRLKFSFSASTLMLLAYLQKRIFFNIFRLDQTSLANFTKNYNIYTFRLDWYRSLAYLQELNLIFPPRHWCCWHIYKNLYFFNTFRLDQTSLANFTKNYNIYTFRLDCIRCWLIYKN